MITGQQVTGGKSWWKAICDAKKPHTRSLFTCQKCPESVDQPLATSPPPAGPVAPGREWKNEQSRAAHSARSRRLRHLLDDIAASPEMFMSLNLGSIIKDSGPVFLVKRCWEGPVGSSGS